MKAIVQTGPEAVEVVDRDPPEVGDDEVLIAVHSTGVCGSDAHAYLYEGGYEWVELPRIMGHEYAGEIVRAGANVDGFATGDRVVEDPTRRCGRCFQCRNNQENVCQHFSVKGMHRDGSYAEYTVGHPENLHVVPDAVALDHAVIAEPLSVAARTVLTRSDLSPGDTALVEGPGPIGVLVAAVADSIGANVIVSGLGTDAAYRLPLVGVLGIETVNLDERDLGDVTDAGTGGGGFDVVFDATGHRSGVEMAIEQVRKGGQVVVVGLPGEPSEVPMATAVRGEVELTTSYGSVWRNFQQALSLLADGVVDPGPIVDTTVSVDDPERAFSAFLAGETCKPVFSFVDG